MKLSDFDYEYPEELVAQHPANERDQSRMMVVHPAEKKWEHKNFFQIPDYFRAGDLLIYNDSRVFPCRIKTTRKTGGHCEFFLIRPLEGKMWEAMATPSKKIRKGDVFNFKNKLIIEILDHHDGGGQRKISLEYDGNLHDLLSGIGEMPLPPYIKRKSQNPQDIERYQTVYADKTGSVAAPTAGLHFTPQILDQLIGKQIELCPVTLHVGLGTFLPIRSESILGHHMHTEIGEIPLATAIAIRKAKKEGRRITVVGTTAVRALESMATEDDHFVREGFFETSKFIHEPYQFKIVDRLITNFHQPKSTLLVLVAAMAGLDFIRQVYDEAIRQKYRLFSYGDCMLIEKS